MIKSYEFNFRTHSVLNARWHWAERHRYMKEAQAFAAAYWKINLRDWRPSLPCKVTLTRIAPSKMDKHDNLRAAMKPIVDSLARIIGVDDGDERVTWAYAQEKGKPRVYAVRVTIRETRK